MWPHNVRVQKLLGGGWVERLGFVAEVGSDDATLADNRLSLPVGGQCPLRAR